MFKEHIFIIVFKILDNNIISVKQKTRQSNSAGFVLFVVCYSSRLFLYSSKVFLNAIAIVSGPTPPGTGVI